MQCISVGYSVVRSAVHYCEKCGVLYFSLVHIYSAVRSVVQCISFGYSAVRSAVHYCEKFGVLYFSRVHIYSAVRSAVQCISFGYSWVGSLPHGGLTGLSGQVSASRSQPPGGQELGRDSGTGTDRNKQEQPCC